MCPGEELPGKVRRKTKDQGPGTRDLLGEQAGEEKERVTTFRGECGVYQGALRYKAGERGKNAGDEKGRE